MKRSLSFIAAGLLAIAVAGCSSVSTGPTTVDSQSSSSSSTLEQTVVTYEGTLQKADASAQQGTHRLSMGEGLFLSLESAALNLDDYLGEDVKVTGTVRPTLDGEGKIMEVSQIVSVLQDLTGSGAFPVISSSSSALLVISSSSSVLIPVSSSSSTPPVVPSPLPPPPKSSSSLSSATSPPPSPPPSSSSQPLPAVPTQVSDDIQALSKSMAKASADHSTWTQKYCTSYVGFCFPFQKLWYFKSFGAKTASLWHVELSSKEIENVGDGPLVINFVSGSLPGGVVDSSVVTLGDTITGFREWTGQRHFEVSGPVVLKDAVEYLTQQLATYEPPLSP